MNELTPKWFDSILTGDSSRAAGLLHKEITLKNLNNLDSPDDISYTTISNDKKKIKKIDKTIFDINLSPIPDGMEWAVPLYSLDTININGSNKLHIKIEPLNIKVVKTIKETKITELLFRVQLIAKNSNNETLFRFSQNTYKPLDTLETFYDKTISNKLLEPYLIKYVEEYLLADAISVNVEVFLNDTEEIIENFINQNKQAIIDADAPGKILFKYISDMDYYPVGLDFYINTYKTLQSQIPEDKLTMMSQSSLNMRLMNYISKLNNVKDQLPHVTKTPEATLDPMFSEQQVKSIATEKPLHIVQAGAGTGKSTTIMERLHYMQKCGISMNDVTVLSFTNAAADNIRDKMGPDSGIYSVTIASMMTSIYSHNFPHVLSTEATMLNSIDIVYTVNKPKEVKEFTRLLKAMTGFNGAKPEDFKALGDFVYKNLRFVIETLNKINQVSLSLQIMICYELIDQLQIPDEAKSKHMIVDEVQDNSIFEFIYLIKSAALFKQSLFIVGDASQTLYAFRDANPRVLNILESSGVFETNTLETNYRSNQEILNFANLMLDDIEANRFAKINLIANGGNQTTIKSFKEKVQLKHNTVGSTRSMANNLNLFKIDILPYVDEKLKKGEKVTILAHARKDVQAIQDILEDSYPGQTANIIPDRSFDSTVFSEFIKKDWHQVEIVDVNSLPSMIDSIIKSNIERYTNSQNEEVITYALKAYSMWRETNENNINYMIQAYNNGNCSKDDVLNGVKFNMLNHEINNNAIRQSLTNGRNQELKERSKGANILLSTIHSAKGLEFEHVVVLYKQSGQNMSEEDKRMYYVAFTRAMESELIWSFCSKNAQSDAASNYNQIVTS